MFGEFSHLGTANAHRLGLMPDAVKAQEFVLRISEDRDLEALRTLYRIRRDYFRYPIIHIQTRSTSFLSDLERVLSLEVASELIPAAIELAEEETDLFFSCSLYLLNILSGGVFHASDRAAIERRLVALRPRAQGMSFYPNITFCWNQMIGNMVEGPVSTHAISSGDWEQDPDNAFPPVPGDPDHVLCPIPQVQVRERAPGCGDAPFRFEFIQNGVCRGNRYWFWLNRNLAESPIWHWYVYVVQSPVDGHCIKTYSMHSNVNTDPEKLALLDFFGIAD